MITILYSTALSSFWTWWIHQRTLHVRSDGRELKLAPAQSGYYRVQWNDLLIISDLENVGMKELVYFEVISASRKIKFEPALLNRSKDARSCRPEASQWTDELLWPCVHNIVWRWRYARVVERPAQLLSRPLVWAWPCQSWYIVHRRRTSMQASASAGHRCACSTGRRL